VKSKTKAVYYCDFCKKHGLSRYAMEKHERHCTLNPQRLCRWVILDYFSPREPTHQPHQMRKGLPRWLRMRRPITKDVIDKLREYASGCPACMLAAVRQAKLDHFHDYDHTFNWIYEDEVKRFREDEKDFWDQRERWEIERTFL
jgi:hypothetical protein